MSYLTSPVPDLASTLVTQAEIDADDENLRFLRTPMEAADDTGNSRNISSVNNSSNSTLTNHGSTQIQMDPRNHRLHRQLNQLNQIQRARRLQATTQDRRDGQDGQGRPDQQDSQDRNDSQSERREPEDRVEMMRRLSRLSRLEDQSRAERLLRNRSGQVGESTERLLARRTRSEDEEAELHEIVEELRRDNPNLHPDVANIMARSQLDREREMEVEARARIAERRAAERQSDRRQMVEPDQDQQRRETEARDDTMLRRRLDALDRRNDSRSDSLRSTAIMQNAWTSNNNNNRMHSTTNRMIQYIRDREQIGTETDNQSQDPSTLSRWTRMSSAIGVNPELDTAVDRFTEEEPAGTGESPWYRRERLNNYRREYLSDNPSTRATLHKSSAAAASDFLENAVRYLDLIRQCTTYDEALAAAIDTGFATKEFFADKHDDFIMDVTRCPSPSYSSWLQSGARFGGSQHTTFQPDSDRTPRSPSSLDPTRTFDATRPWLSHSFDAHRMYPHALPMTSSQPLGHWPVKVTLHVVDEINMMISGTMEAFDVPGSPAPLSSHGSIHNRLSANILNVGPGADLSSKPRNPQPITTYVEGQIVDFRTHSFLTPGQSNKKSSSSGRQNSAFYSLPDATIRFPTTTPQIDANNWRRLPPFNSVKDDDEVARTLLSHDRMAEISSQYIFMRWKERCFIHSHSDTCANSPRCRNVNPDQSVSSTTTTTTNDAVRSSAGGGHGTGSRTTNGRLGEGDDTDTGHGLTISGFYYVSLCRADGRVEGLYFDPSTSPYQCLKLRGVRGGTGRGLDVGSSAGDGRREVVGGGGWGFR